MRSLRLGFGLAVLIAASLAARAQQLSPGEEPDGAQARSVTAFIDVHILPMDRERALDHQTVLISDGKIVAMGDRGRDQGGQVRRGALRALDQRAFAASGARR